MVAVCSSHPLRLSKESAGFRSAAGAIVWLIRISCVGAILLAGCQWTSPVPGCAHCNSPSCRHVSTTTRHIEYPPELGGFIGLYPTHWAPWPDEEPSVYGPDNDVHVVTETYEQHDVIQPHEGEQVPLGEPEAMSNTESTQLQSIVDPEVDWGPNKAQANRVRLRRSS